MTVKCKSKVFFSGSSNRFLCSNSQPWTAYHQLHDGHSSLQQSQYLVYLSPNNPASVLPKESGTNSLTWEILYCRGVWVHLHPQVVQNFCEIVGEWYQPVLSFDPKQLSCNAPMLCSNGHDLEISGVLKGIIKNPRILEDYIREFPPNWPGCSVGKVCVSVRLVERVITNNYSLMKHL